VARGAEFVIGDGGSAGSVLLNLSIITNVDLKSKMAQNEAFIPVAVLYTFEIEEDVVKMANARAGGLSANVFAMSFEHGLKTSRLLELGQVQVNEHTDALSSKHSSNGMKG